MEAVCRLCLKLTEQYVPIDDNNIITNRKKIAEFLPDVVLDIGSCVLCLKCSNTLQGMHELKATCLKTEETIGKYVDGNYQCRGINFVEFVSNVLETAGPSTVHLIPTEFVSCDEGDYVNEPENMESNLDVNKMTIDVDVKCEICDKTVEEIAPCEGRSSSISAFDECEAKCSVRLKCDECDMIFTSMYQLKKHHSSHKRECDICFKRFKQEYQRNVHMADLHGCSDKTGKHQCNNCDARFFTENALLRHLSYWCTTSKEMSSSEESLTSTPPDLRQLAENVLGQLLPEKSRFRYEAQFNVFKQWCEGKGVTIYTENVLLAYFNDLVEKKRKSLWAVYSMLRSCLLLKNNIDISKFARLIAYLRRKTSNYKPKKSRVLEEIDIIRFLNEAPDTDFLLMKVALIIGVSGALRREELYKMMIDHVQLKDDVIIIVIPETKASRSFAITKQEWVTTVVRYLHIRMKNTKIPDRFFLRFEKGKCSNSPVGINTLGSIPSKVAMFLKLEKANEYTGHCFRRSSATLKVNRGVHLLTLKRHGGWKSGSIAEGYVEESLKRKIDVANMKIEAGPSTSKKSAPDTSAITSSISNKPSSFKIEIDQNTSSVSGVMPGLFSGVENCSINVNIYNNYSINK